MELLQTLNINKSFYQNFLLLREKSSNNFLFSPPLFLSFKKLVSIFISYWPSCFLIEWLSRLRQSSLIGSEKANYLLFVAYYKAKKENKAKIRIILEKTLKVNANNNYICFLLKESNSDKDNSFNKDKNDNYWENIADGFQKYTQFSWIDINKILKGKEKLIRILA